MHLFGHVSLAEILEKRNDKRAAEMRVKAEKLKVAINTEMWDERDGIYYSQDINFHKTERTVKGVAFHSGLAPNWKTMPLKIRFWGCFLPMYAGICDEERVQRMCAHLIFDKAFVRIHAAFFDSLGNWSDIICVHGIHLCSCLSIRRRASRRCEAISPPSIGS